MFTRASLLLVAISTSVYADDTWVGKRVMAKKHDIKIGDSIDGKQVYFDLEDPVPQVVKDENGSIRLRDANSHDREGWADKNDFVLLVDAPAFYTDIIRSDATRTWAWNQRGLAWKEKGEIDNAIKDFDEAIRLDPRYPSLFNNRAGAWVRKKDYDKAIKDFDEAIRLAPTDPVAFYNRGTAWSRKKSYDEAIRDFDEAIKLDPKNVRAFYNRGNAWKNKKDYAKAIEDFDESIRLDPGHVKSINNKAYLLTVCLDDNIRDVAKAKELLKQVIQLRKESPYNEDTLSVIAAADGHFDDAIRHQKKALADKEYAENDGEKAKERLKAYEQKKPWRE